MMMVFYNHRRQSRASLRYGQHKLTPRRQTVSVRKRPPSITKRTRTDRHDLGVSAFELFEGWIHGHNRRPTLTCALAFFQLDRGFYKIHPINFWPVLCRGFATGIFYTNKFFPYISNKRPKRELWPRTAPSQRTRDILPMLAQCWSSVADAGPTLSQHRENNSCSLGW